MNSRLGIVVTMLSILILIGVLRGNGTTPSIIGVIKCQPLDNSLLVILIISGIVLTAVGAYLNRDGYLKKKEYGYTFT